MPYSSIGHSNIQSINTNLAAVGSVSSNHDNSGLSSMLTKGNLDQFESKNSANDYQDKSETLKHANTNFYGESFGHKGNPMNPF